MKFWLFRMKYIIDWDVYLIISIYNYKLFYKKYFYKQRQAEMGKKLSKSEVTPWRWTFAIWKLFVLFIHVMIEK